jgi:hypothetical protein
VEKKLKNGEDPNKRELNYPLTAALIYNPEMVDILLEYGAEKTDSGSLPWETIVYCDEKTEHKLLNSYDLDPDEWNKLVTSVKSTEFVEDDIPPTALEAAVGFGNKETVDILLGKGVDINKQDTEGKNSLIVACELEDYSYDNETEFKERLEIIQLLLDFGADVSAQDNSGKCAKDYFENGVQYLRTTQLYEQNEESISELEQCLSK